MASDKDYAVWLAQEPCEICGARPGRDPKTGIEVKNGHRDFCAYVPLAERAVVSRAANVIRQAAQGALDRTCTGIGTGLGQIGYQQQLQQIQNAQAQQQAYNPFVQFVNKSYAEPSPAPKTYRAPSGSNEEWLDRRVNEIRVKLT